LANKCAPRSGGRLLDPDLRDRQPRRLDRRPRVAARRGGHPRLRVADLQPAGPTGSATFACARRCRSRSAARHSCRSSAPHPDEAFAIALGFRRRYPWRLRLFATILGWGDLSSDAAVRRLVRDRPFISFRPGNP